MVRPTASTPAVSVPRAWRGDRGVALVTALFLIALVTMSLLLVARTLQLRSDGFQRERRDVRLTALADAALAATLAELDRDRYFPGLVDREFGGGRISSTVDGDPESMVTVSAAGTFQDWTATIDARVVMGSSRPRVVSWQCDRHPG